METVGFNFAFIYRYSERKGTKAYSMNNAVPEGIRIERLKKAVALQNSITYKNNKDYIGSDVTMLVNNPSKDGAGWFGFSETGIPVVFATDKRDVRAGSFVTVRIESTTGASLVGKAL
jgi:tRNA A37 methylthiotransferase MiaB